MIKLLIALPGVAVIAFAIYTAIKDRQPLHVDVAGMPERDYEASKRAGFVA